MSRSPSLQWGEAWSTPGLVASPGRPGVKSYKEVNNAISWSSAQERRPSNYAQSSFSSHNRGFLGKHFRSISNSLPQFGRPVRNSYLEKEKLYPCNRSLLDLDNLRQFIPMLWRNGWRLRKQLAIMVACIIALVLFLVNPLHSMYNRHPRLGGGKKFVLILAANEGGGVMEWKGPREWAIERDSIKNKRKYAKRWGYDLEIVDMAIKKRYAHEWRESWEKVDTIRRCLREYPDAEWFWWLDLNTFIMEPSYSLQRHIFNDLIRNTYRDINEYNPLNITHPLTASYLDELSTSLDGNNLSTSINIIVPQDCSGFNLGSFFVRRSVWTDRLLDIWWDPVHYEQKHMDWEHKEQDAFEYLYQSQPWIRPHTAFIPQRKVCSFPPGACGEGDPKIHYHEQDRDFLVSMAGCSWGRDCWGEMYNFRELSNKLNRTLWEKFKDSLSDLYRNLIVNKLKRQAE